MTKKSRTRRVGEEEETIGTAPIPSQTPRTRAQMGLMRKVARQMGIRTAMVMAMKREGGLDHSRFICIPIKFLLSLQYRSDSHRVQGVFSKSPLSTATWGVFDLSPRDVSEAEIPALAATYHQIAQESLAIFSNHLHPWTLELYLTSERILTRNGGNRQQSSTTAVVSRTTFEWMQVAGQAVQMR